MNALSKFVDSQPRIDLQKMPLAELQFLYGYLGMSKEDYQREVRRRSGDCPHMDGGWCRYCVSRGLLEK